MIPIFGSEINDSWIIWLSISSWKHQDDRSTISIDAEPKFACDQHHDRTSLRKNPYLYFHRPPTPIRPKTQKTPG